MAVPEYKERVQEADPTLFEEAVYESDCILKRYWPSAAWAWAVCEQEHPKMILYTDV